MWKKHNLWRLKMNKDYIALLKIDFLLDYKKKGD